MITSILVERSESDVPAGQCGMCGQLCRKGSKYGFCNRTAACRKARNNAYYAANKAAILERQRRDYAAKPERALKAAAAYREANRTQIRERKRDIAYGLAPGEYQLILTAQSGRCKGCHRAVKLYVDHDHGCCMTTPTCGQCNRGLLCEACNWVLGFAKDSPATLRALAAHLEEQDGPRSRGRASTDVEARGTDAS